MDNSEWLAALKVGDMVAQCAGHWSRTYNIFAVERLTPTQIIANKGRRFKRKNGFPAESRTRSFGARYAIEPVTQEIRDANELENLRNWMDGLRPKNMTLPVLRAIKQAHDSTQGAK